MSTRQHAAAAGLPALVLLGIAGCGGGSSSGGVFDPPATTATLSIGDVTLAEGTGQDTTFSFAVTLSEARQEAVQVDFETFDGSAESESGDGDYEAQTGTLVFPAGTTAASVDVRVVGDTKYEPDETFGVRLANLQGPALTILDGEALGTIETDDFAASAELSVEAVALQQPEGNSGQAGYDFAVTLSAPLAEDVRFDFGTVDGTAEDEGGDGDYQATSGALTIPSGQVEAHVNVLVNGDTKVEPPESFLLRLSNVQGAGAKLLAAEAKATIDNEDSAGFSVDDVSQLEADFGAFEVVFTVRMSAEHTSVVTVDYSTFDGSATANPFGGDYTATSGTLTFDPGTTELAVTVMAAGDLDAEGDETFGLELTEPAGTDVFLLDAFADANLLDNDSDLRLDTDTVGGGSYGPQVAAVGAHVYAAWSDDRDGNRDVYFSASNDGGASWFANDVRLDTDTPGAAGSTDVGLAADGDEVYVVWLDDRGGQTGVYFNRSTDNGLTWLADDLRVDAGAGNAAAPRVAAANGRVHVAWTDDRNGLDDVFFNTSQDGGATWLPSDVRLDLDPVELPGATLSEQPELAVEGDAVHVVWTEGGDVYSNASTDGGLSWLTSHVRVDTAPNPGAEYAGHARLAVEGSSVYVVWEDGRDGAADVYFNASFDGGVSFGAADVRLETGDAPGANPSVTPQLAAAGSEVYVVWEEEGANPSNPGFGDIRFRRSADGGANWDAVLRLDTGTFPGKAESRSPQVAAAAGAVFATWVDQDRGGLFDVRGSLSNDGGQTWIVSPFRLDTDQGGAANSFRPELAMDAGQVFVVWEDERFALDVFFRTMLFE